MDTMDRSTLEGKLLPELQQIAQTMGIEGSQRLRKAGLIDAIVEASSNGERPDNGEASARPSRETAVATIDGATGDGAERATSRRTEGAEDDADGGSFAEGSDEQQPSDRRPGGEDRQPDDRASGPGGSRPQDRGERNQDRGGPQDRGDRGRPR